MYGLMIFSTFGGVGKVGSDESATVAEVVAESRASVAAWMRAVSEEDEARAAVGAGTPAAVVTVGWWREWTRAAAATSTSARHASTTVALKAPLLPFWSRFLWVRDLRVRGAARFPAELVSPPTSPCTAAWESTSSSASDGAIADDSTGATDATVAAFSAIRASTG